MQSQRLLHSYSFSPYLKIKLSEAGFTVVEDLRAVSAVALSKEAKISHEEAEEVLAMVLPENSEEVMVTCLTALELLQREQEQCSIITFSQRLDHILDGGIPLGKTTEICGAPATGKTQLCLQLCVDVQIPEYLGGFGGEAVFIDTEASFNVERLVDIAQGCLQHCQHICQKNGSKSDSMSSFTMESILRGVHYYRCVDYVELVALVNILPDFIKRTPKLRLVVIDSIAFHFRYGFEGNLAVRSRILNNMAQSLIKLAFQFQLAVVLTNQMTTRIDSQGQGGLVPSLGESWGHACTLRLVLHWREGQRRGLLLKSPSRKEDTAPFQIISAGIRDVVEVPPTVIQDPTDSPQQSSKRPKLKD